MNKLLFILFITKLYTRISISKRLKKHRQDIEKLSKTIENSFAVNAFDYKNKLV